MPEPIVLICMNANGAVIEVGLFESIDAARPHVARNAGRDRLYTVWTPRLNEVIEAATVRGLSLPGNAPEQVQRR
jgi:hypothetical protein